MSNQAENKAERVKVEDVEGFSSWFSFLWCVDLVPDKEGVWDQKGFSWHQEPMVRDCKRAVSREPESRWIVARYPLDPEALYFDAANPDGIPVEWDDEKTV